MVAHFHAGPVYERTVPIATEFIVRRYVLQVTAARAQGHIKDIYRNSNLTAGELWHE
jgi:hypothetical protein